jgi:UPF0755 protein
LRRSIRTIFIAALVTLAAGLTIPVYWLRSELKTPYYNAPYSEVFLEIPKHATTNQVATLLVDSGILHSRLPFLLYVRYRNLGRHIQAGEYRFAEAVRPEQVAQKLIRGEIYFRSVTIPEGLTAGETIDLLVKNGLGNREELEPLVRRTEWIRDLDPKAKNLEGYLFPETYRFSREVDSESIIKAMVHQFRVRAAKVITQPRPGWTIRSLVILASMIEKEAKKEDERPMVASVLVNRLDKGMPLACDATIIYALKLAGTYSGRLGKMDLAMESPYNSYLHLNLPPGPICNPGERSLRAALNPAHTDYLFYVSRNDGTHQFSMDFDSHQHAVDRYQKSGARQTKKK